VCAFDESVVVVDSLVVPYGGAGSLHELVVSELFAFWGEGGFEGDEGAIDSRLVGRV
jgi:hypothetical protein